MADLNNFTCTGRLTRDPEMQVLQTGTKLAKFGFAVSKRKRCATGWEDAPVFLDVTCFGKNADTAEQLRKGERVGLTGELRLDQWKDKDGNNRSKITFDCERIIFIEAKKQDASQGQEPAPPAPVKNKQGGMYEDNPF